MDDAALGRLTAEQRGMLTRLVQVFAADERVMGAWLGGSLAGDAYDAWSDIDFHLMVGEGDYSTYVSEAYRLLVGCGSPLQHWPGLATPQVTTYAAWFDDGTYVDLHVHNAAHGATFFTASPVGPLFGQPPTGPPFQAAPLAERHEVVKYRLLVFWLQVFFAAKFIARDDALMAAGYLTCARGTLVQLLDLREAHPLWTGPPILWATYGRISAADRRLMTPPERSAATLHGELEQLLAAAAELLPALAAEAGCGAEEERLAATVTRRIRGA